MFANIPLCPTPDFWAYRGIPYAVAPIAQTGYPNVPMVAGIAPQYPASVGIPSLATGGFDPSYGGWTGAFGQPWTQAAVDPRTLPIYHPLVNPMFHPFAAGSAAAFHPFLDPRQIAERAFAEATHQEMIRRSMLAASLQPYAPVGSPLATGPVYGAPQARPVC